MAGPNNGKKRPHDARAQRPATNRPASGGSGRRRANGPTPWLETHGRDLRFLLAFAGLMLVYYFITTTQVMKDDFFPWYLAATARVSGAVLGFFGYDGVEVMDKVVSAPGGWITVERGCDAVAPTALFLSAVLASPAPVRSKLVAVFGGTLTLMIINVVRIITLFLTRVHWREAFDVMHLDIWQAAFIFLAILLWATWASWTTRRRRRVQHA